MTLTGKGKSEKRANPSSLLLFNFDIDGDTLKEEHKTFLRTEALPILRTGSNVRVVGLADRLGGTALHAHNQQLSVKRAQRTVEFLRKEIPGVVVRQETGFGEDAAAREGEKAGSKDERFRSVLLFFSREAPPATNTKVIEVTAKSFIAHIGSHVGTMPGIAMVPNPLVFPAPLIPVPRQVLLERWAAALELEENPLNSANDRKCRLFTSCKFTVVFEANKILAATPGIPDLEAQVGMEGPVEPPPLIVSPVTVSPKGSSFVTFSWWAKGRPHMSAEIGFNTVKPRSSVYIWHAISGKIDVSSGTPVTTINLRGSKFPSHRVFVNNTLIFPQLRQGPFSDLWVSDPSDSTKVK